MRCSPGAWRSPARAACRRSRCAATPPSASSRESGIAGLIEPDRALSTGVTVETDLGEWIVYETPGHAPSHVCLFQPERRLLISGDHLLGRISLYFDYGYSPDPVGEFLQLARRRRAARRAPVPARPRAHVRRRARPHRGQPRARRRAPGTRRARRSASGPLTRLRDRAARVRRVALRAERALAAVEDPRLPDAPAGPSGARAGFPASPSAGLHNRCDAHRRDPRRRAGRCSRSSSSRPKPTPASRTCTRRWPSCAARAVVRVGHLRRGRLDAGRRRSRSSSGSREEYGLEAMAHFTCVGATVAELRATLDEMQQAGHRQRARAARRSARRGRRSGRRPRAAWSTRASWSS